MIKVGEQQILLQAELYKGEEKQDSALTKKKIEIFEKVVKTIEAPFD